MTWTAPRTWVSAEVPNAALMNTHIRDNLLASEAAVVTTAGDLAYATGANTLARLAKGTSGHRLQVASGVPAWASVGATQPLLGDTHKISGSAERETSYSDWPTPLSTEYAAVSDPGVNVDIFVFWHCRNLLGDDWCGYYARPGVSIDGGSNWTYGPEDYVYGDSEVYVFRQQGMYYLANQNPTGEIRAKLQEKVSNTSYDGSAGAGQITLLVVKLT